MNYELAKRLKDAGFPQHEGEYRNILEDDGKERVYTPDLGELVRECGERFQSLLQCQCTSCAWNVHGDEKIDGWDDEMDGRGCFKGQTPEEAVANLWLALHAT